MNQTKAQLQLAYDQLLLKYCNSLKEITRLYNEMKTFATETLDSLKGCNHKLQEIFEHIREYKEIIELLTNKLSEIENNYDLVPKSNE